jgi:hypothetical protein
MNETKFRRCLRVGSRSFLYQGSTGSAGAERAKLENEQAPLLSLPGPRPRRAASGGLGETRSLSRAGDSGAMPLHDSDTEEISLLLVRPGFSSWAAGVTVT